jgi:hypothetical protein
VVQTFIRNVYSWIADTFSYDVLFAEKELVLGCAYNDYFEKIHDKWRLFEQLKV